MSTPTSPAAPAGGCPVHHGYEPFAQNDPFPSYAALRENEPVMYDERVGYWVVSRYDDIKAVFSDWETFSSENAQAPVRERGPQAKKIMEEGGFTAYSGLSARIPPDHTRIRKIAAKAFTPRRFKVLEPDIRANVVRLLEQMLSRPEKRGDLVRDLAYDVPTITILTLIGADVSQIDQFKTWSDSRSAMTWGDLTDEEQIPHAHNLVAYWAECRRLVAEAHETERDSLVGDLVRMQAEGAEITDHEIASLCYSLLFAGHETTTTLISNVLRELLTHRDQWQKVLDDPSTISSAVDETLRFSPSIVGWRRKALADAVVGGVEVPAGAELLLLMGSANRDEDRFDEPDTFDVTRPNAREHLSFGYGIHHCLGNLLAKLQAKIVLEEVTRLAPDLRLVEPETIRFGDNLSFRAPVVVPVSWDEARGAAGGDAGDAERGDAGGGGAAGDGPAHGYDDYVVFFDSDREPRLDELGGKCASLVSMTAAGMPVPPGFALTTAAFDDFIDGTGLRAEVAEKLSGVDPDDVDSVERISAEIREAICSRDVPASLQNVLRRAYDSLMSRFSEEVPLAVRSSATAEDLPDASFAGQQDTYLWLRGYEEVQKHARQCWASLYTSRAILYRLRNDIPETDLSMAIAVQKMVNARSAGVAMTLDPANGDRSKIVIDSSWGVGEMVVSGLVTPDNILLDKVMLTVVRETIGDKHAELVPDADAGALVEREVPGDRRAIRSLTDDELQAVAAMAKRAEKHYGSPQDVEWAIDADLPDGQNLLMLQSRPETVHSQTTPDPAPATTPAAGGFMSGITSSLTTKGSSR